MRQVLPHNPDQLVFSGGGLRCFWQGGFMTTLTESRSLAPKRLTGVSGGALAGAAYLAGREHALLEEMCAAFAAQDSNIDLFHAGDAGLTPHQSIYCEVVDKVIDAEAARRIAEGPAFQILIAHPPDSHLPTLSGMAMTVAYEAELHSINAPHFGWAEKMGLDYSLVDANAAAREGRLFDLICAAAVIPPVFEPPEWDGRPVVDGGMADQAPMPDPDEGTTMILLTRKYRTLPDMEGRFYLHPGEETPADKIDFTDPEKLRATWAQGEADARRLIENHPDG
ncbi:Patatin-like phospholipase [Roseivivax lentus]|uniref:Patatin-like phospholipase n=1 Tax=Roseivivax lentus TaxID=633194 RepID=A0A1N7KC83_9RHOB|nr:patatin-like phospholipase family protein [Roseivivax lentus]SIS59163.1 Patatin-like phospholipase [Roseivivax lentus]